MSQSVQERLKAFFPKIKIYNASDRVQKFSYNSQVYTFQPGRGTEIVGQEMPEKDAFGRVMEYGGSIPNPDATVEKITEFLLNEGRDKGLVLLRNDSSDKGEVEEAEKRYVRANTREMKNIEHSWLQKVAAIKAAGGMPPAMPEYVEQAQDFLSKNRNGLAGTHKRFIVDLDNRSFATKKEAQKHISSRYPAKAAAWETHVTDTQAGEEEQQEAVQS